MADLPAARRATQPQRRFSPDDLAGLDRDERRKLTQLLLTETGSRVERLCRAKHVHDVRSAGGREPRHWFTQLRDSGEWRNLGRGPHAD